MLCDKIVDIINDNNNVDVNALAENKLLQHKLAKTLGFDKVLLNWTFIPNDNSTYAATTLISIMRNRIAGANPKDPKNLIKGTTCIISLSSYNIYAMGKTGEEYADSFATSYGYGEALISGMGKIHKNMTTPITDNKFAMLLSKISLLELELTEAVVQPTHGTQQNRTKVMINKLHRDLDNNEFSPEVREILLEEIENLETYYNKYTLMDKDEKSIFVITLRCAIEKYLKGIPDIYNVFIPSGKTM